MDDTTDEACDPVFSVNVRGTFLCSREAISIMKRNRVKGHIIAISSIAGLIGSAGYSAYSASKFAVRVYEFHSQRIKT